MLALLDPMGVNLGLFEDACRSQENAGEAWSTIYAAPWQNLRPLQVSSFGDSLSWAGHCPFAAFLAWQSDCLPRQYWLFQMAASASLFCLTVALIPHWTKSTIGSLLFMEICSRVGMPRNLMVSTLILITDSAFQSQCRSFCSISCWWISRCWWICFCESAGAQFPCIGLGMIPPLYIKLSFLRAPISISQLAGQRPVSPSTLDCIYILYAYMFFVMMFRLRTVITVLNLINTLWPIQADMDISACLLDRTTTLIISAWDLDSTIYLCLY